MLEPVTSFAYEGWEGAAVEWSQKYLEDVLDRIKERWEELGLDEVLTIF